MAIAKEVARELYETIKATVKADTIIVVPLVPTAPLRWGRLMKSQVAVACFLLIGGFGTPTL
jgi:hypothetical protein